MQDETDYVADYGDLLLELEAEMKAGGRQAVDAGDLFKRIGLYRQKMRRYYKSSVKTSRLRKYCLHKKDAIIIDDDMLVVLALLLAKHLFQEGSAPVTAVARICELTADKSRGIKSYLSLVHEMAYASILKITSRPLHNVESNPLVMLGPYVLKDVYDSEIMNVDSVAKEIRIRKNRERRKAKRRRRGKKGEDNP